MTAMGVWLGQFPAPATKAAFKTDQELFRLNKRERQWIEIADPEPPEMRRGGKVIDIEYLRRAKGLDEET